MLKRYLLKKWLKQIKSVLLTGKSYHSYEYLEKIGIIEDVKVDKDTKEVWILLD